MNAVKTATIAADFSNVDLDALRAALTAAEVDFAQNTGVKKLVAKAQDNNVTIPLIGNDDQSGEVRTATLEDGGEDEDGETETKKSKNVVPAKYRAKYGKEQNCGDEMAAALKKFVTNPDGTCNPTTLEVVADANGLHETLMGYRNSGKNIGMQRMNIGNILRGRVKNGKKVTVGERVWEEQKEEARATKL